MHRSITGLLWRSLLVACLCSAATRAALAQYPVITTAPQPVIPIVVGYSPGFSPGNQGLLGPNIQGPRVVARPVVAVTPVVPVGGHPSPIAIPVSSPLTSYARTVAMPAVPVYKPVAPVSVAQPWLPPAVSPAIPSRPVNVGYSSYYPPTSTGAVLVPGVLTVTPPPTAPAMPPSWNY